jgi:hypothetical protein
MITLAPELADANPGLEHILSNLDLIGASWRQIVRDDFAYFRQHIRPGMLWGFWNEVVAIELTEFYKDFVAGKRPAGSCWRAGIVLMLAACVLKQ